MDDDDDFSSLGASLSSPAEDGSPIEPDDEATFKPTRALWIGTPGDLKVKMKSGNVVTYRNAQGQMSLRITQLLIDTTAEDIVALW